MNSILRNFCLSALAVGVLSAAAVPAKRDPRTVVQPDGTPLTVSCVGDEHAHYMLSGTGHVLMPIADGSLVYATPAADGTLLSTGVPAQLAAPADAFTLTSAQGKDVVRKARARAAASAPFYAPTQRAAEGGEGQNLIQYGMGCFTNNFPRRGDVNILVILVQYKDVEFQVSDPKDYFTRMLTEKGFSDYGATGSATDYFLANSGGQWTPHIDVYGPVTLPENRVYYGQNGFAGDRQPQKQIIDGCKLLDEEIDFTKYDNDSDGVVDNVFCFYAGLGENAHPEQSNLVWPHSSNLILLNEHLTLDGVVIDRYATTNEWNDDRPDGIGTFVHEFSHVMGLPDLYHTDDAYAFYTPDCYSVMDYGPYNNNSCTPPNYSIYERNALGWSKPQLISGPFNGRLENFGDSNKGYIIPTERENEFYLFENRQQTGWDKYIPGHGMLIWHVDFDQQVFDANTVNNTQRHQYVDIVEANNNPSSHIVQSGQYVLNTEALEGYTWPGREGKTEFTPATIPAFRSWNAVDVDLPLTSIAEDEEGVVTFLVAGGDDGVHLDAPAVAEEPQEFGADADNFTATWSPVEGATDYQLTVYALGQGDGLTETADMGSSKSYLKLPEGWTSSTTDIYSSTGFYGAAAPALKLSKNQAYLQTPAYDGCVTSISYWRNGISSSGSSLRVQVYKPSGWTDIYVDALNPGEAQTVTLDASQIPENVNQIRFLYNKASGNCALDDVVITCKPGDTVVDPYQDYSTQGATTLAVSVPTEKREFAYKVRATDGTHFSAYSPLVRVSMTSSVRALLDAASGAAVYYNLQGMRVLTPRPGDILIERRDGQPARTVIVRK